MDSNQFDAIARAIVTSSSRRGVVCTLAGLALAGVSRSLLAPFSGQAKSKKKKKPCDPCRIKKKGKCKGPKPDGTPCPTGTCQSGACQSANQAPPPPPLETRLDVFCPGPANRSRNEDRNHRVAQTFTPIRSGQLVSASFLLSKFAGTTGDYILQVSTVNGDGIPTGNVIASARLPDASVPAGEGQFQFIFPNPPQVVAGVTFALILSRPDTLGIGFGYVYKNPSACLGAAFDSANATGPVDRPLDADCIFETFIRS